MWYHEVPDEVRVSQDWNVEPTKKMQRNIQDVTDVIVGSGSGVDVC